ncbi:MAG: apolipoprotein N-acyltransferase, partial [Desulfobacterales bacterium]|nr:apolipoprotein N-acyltransferase [Desulfobacterales bacterium]
MNRHHLLSILLPYFPALLSGVMLTAAFPDTGLFQLAFVAVVPLWVSLEAMTSRQAFYAGMITGVTHYLTLIYWLIPTLTIYGKIHILLALACLVLLSLYLALYAGLFALLIKRLPAPPWLAPVWGGVIWVGLEFLRTHALTGFPWGVLGYTQVPNLLLLQTADLAGVLGISFILLVSNGMLARTWIFFTKTGDNKKTTWKHHPGIPLACGVVLISAAFGYGHFRLKTVDQWIAGAEKPVISVIQGNIEQDKKWDKAFKDFTVEQYRRLSLSATPADLVIWPETAVPFYYGRDAVYSSRVDALVRELKSYFLIGSPAADTGDEIIRYYNRAYMLTPMAMVASTYDKTHLVPFGEYVPLQDLLWFIEKITAEAGNFSKGKTGTRPLAFDDHKTGVLICFEILFPDIAREFVTNGADILTPMTTDAWFGRTSAPAQHFAIAALRAVENRRSVVRAANTGISG